MSDGASRPETPSSSPAIDPKIILITDPVRFSLDHTVRAVEAAARAVGPGVLMVQLRDKLSPSLEVARWARTLRHVTNDVGALFCINMIRPESDLVAVVRQVRPDALHVPCDHLQVRQAKSAAAFVTVPAHSESETSLSRLSLADALLVSPIWLVSGAGSTKAMPRGLAAVRAARHRAPSKRIYALGGVNAMRAPMCAAAGAHGVAVISAILATRTPGEAAAALAKPFLPSPEGV